MHQVAHSFPQCSAGNTSDSRHKSKFEGEGRASEERIEDRKGREERDPIFENVVVPVS